MQVERKFAGRWVHLDLKGAPLKLPYLKSLLPLMKSYGSTGLLIEFEDMFPYTDELKVLRSDDAYSENELRDFLSCVESHEMQCVPLVQTFGHLEFLLKHESFCHLREMPEYPNAICPSFEESQRIIKLMISQVMQFFLYAEYFHIGCDEVCYIGLCSACKEKKLTPGEHFIEHVKFVAEHLQSTYSIQPIIWDDMLRGMNVATLKGSGLNKMVDVMAWEYQNVQRINQGHLAMLESYFPNIWFASAFKGATSSCQVVTPTGFHAENHFQWLSVLEAFPRSPAGIVLTGWSRFDHYGSLCDLLPVSLPTLAICLSMASSGYIGFNFGASELKVQSLNMIVDRMEILCDEIKGCFTEEMHQNISTEMGFSKLIPWHPLDKDFDTDCTLNFPGWQIYQGLHLLIRLDRESDALVNGDLRRTWLSKRHVRRAQTSSAIARQLLEMANRFIDRYRHLELGLQECLSEVLFESSVEEWLETHLYPRRDELQDIAVDAGHLIAIGASVVRS